MVQKTPKRWLLWFCGVVLVAALAAGAYYELYKAPDLKPNLESPKPNLEGPKPDISSQPAEIKVKVTLYFSDKQAMYLVPEEREVIKGNQSLEEVILNELIKGPRNPKLVKTIPDGTKLLSVRVVDGVAYVNFSKEFQTKHWGGSAGETFTLYSVINSLAKLEGIQKVQFLLEGEKMDTLAGHFETTEPMGPQWNLVQS
ncbi:MAG: GerMN domain-containing protein [Bacillota bacterium]